MLKFFRVPFALSGTRTPIPDAADPSGFVSYIEGYGPDYQRVKTDPLSKNIERDKMNELFYDLTKAVAEIQSQGVPDFISTSLNDGSPYSYGINALVYYSGQIYVSLVAANTADPTDPTKWAVFNVESLRAALASSASATVGAGMQGLDARRNYAALTTGRAVIDAGPSLTSFSGVVMNDSSAAQRTANSAALLAAAAITKRLTLPPGTLWIDPGVAIPADLQLSGAGKLLTTIKGDGDLFLITTAAFGAPLFSDMTIANDVTRGKLFSTSGVLSDYGRIQFERVEFGTSTHHIVGHATFATVDWYFNGCRFSDASVRSRDIASCWAYKEVACYTWNCPQGMLINTGATITFLGSVFEQISGEPFYALANVVGGIHAVSFIGCHFEQNGSSGASDIRLETTAAARIRSVSFIGGSLYTPNAAMTRRITITEGGGGTIDKVTLKACSVEGSVTLCQDVTRVYVDSDVAFNLITPQPTNQVSPQVNYAARSVLGATGSVHPLSVPSTGWNTDFTQNTPVSIANTGTYDLGAGSGLLVIGEDAGLFGPGVLLVGGGVVNVISQIGTSITNTAGTAASINIFYNAGTTSYRIQNLTGATVDVKLGMLRVRAAN